MRKLIVISTALSLVAALFYILTGAGVFQAGEVNAGGDASGIAFTAAGCYIAGGLLILLKKRWLWLTGAVINAIVIFIFYSMYIGNTAIMLSIPGLGTKVPQIILEVILIYLVARYKQSSALLDWVHQRPPKQN